MKGQLIVRHIGNFPQIFNGEVDQIFFKVQNSGFSSIRFISDGKWYNIAGKDISWIFNSEEPFEAKFNFRTEIIKYV